RPAVADRPARSTRRRGTRRPLGVDLVFPRGNDLVFDPLQLIGRIFAGVSWLADVAPGGADVLLGVDRVTPLLVVLVPRIRIFDIAVVPGQPALAGGPGDVALASLLDRVDHVGAGLGRADNPRLRGLRR